MLSEGVIDIPLSAIASIPKRKAICCKNCDWQNQGWCSLRWEAVEMDEICSCHPRINPKVQEYLAELGKKFEDEMQEVD